MVKLARHYRVFALRNLTCGLFVRGGEGARCLDTAEWMSLWRDVDDLLSSLPFEGVAISVCSCFCSCTSQWSTAVCVLALFCVGAGAHRLRGPTSHRLSTLVGAEEGQISSSALLGMLCCVSFPNFQEHADFCRATEAFSLWLVAGKRVS